MDIHSVFPFSELPWLLPALAWAIAVILFWLLASFPALFAARLLHKLQEELSTANRNIEQRFQSSRNERREQRQSATSKIHESELYRSTGYAKNVLFNNMIDKMLNPLDRAAELFKSAERALQKSVDSLTRLLDSLRSLNVRLAEIPVPREIEPDHAQFAQSHNAWPTFIGGTLILCSIIVVNTGMLSQILKDLGVAPPSLRIGSIQLYWIFAVLLTMVEAGIGFLHGVLSHENQPKRGPSLGPLFAIVGAIAIAFVEGFFYSRIGADRKESFSLPFIGVSVPFEQVFFIWGVVLVLSLFGFGSVVYRAATMIREGSIYRKASKRIQALHRVADGAVSSLHQLKNDYTKTVDETIAATGCLTSLTDPNAQRTLDALAEIRNSLVTLKEQPPDWATATQHKLSEMECRNLGIKAGVLTWLSLLMMIALSWLSLPLILSLFPSLSGAALILASIGLSLSFFVLGVLLQPVEVITSSAAQIGQAVASRRFTPVRVFLLALALLLLLTILLSRLGSFPIGLLVGILLFGVVLVLCGRELSSAFVLAGLHLRALLDVLVMVAQEIFCLLLRLFLLVVVIAKYLCDFLSFPISRFVRQTEYSNDSAPKA